MLYSVCSLLAAILLLSRTGTAAPTDTAATNSAVGCGKTLHLKGVDVNRKVDGDRNYWYRLPSNYDKNKQYPVVLGFHGSSRLGGTFDGLAFAADSKLSLSKYSGDVCAQA